MLTCLTRDADYHYYAERGEHVEASGVEDVPEAHYDRQDQPGGHDGGEENRLGSHYRRRHLADEQ